MERASIKGHQVVCSGLIQRPDGKILIVFCPGFKTWRVPGGRCEHGEKVEDTLLREMKEELGMDLENPLFLGYGQDQQIEHRKSQETSRLLMFFLLKTDKEDIVRPDPEEIEKHMWVPLEQIKELEDKEGGLTDFFERNPGLTL